LSEISDDVLMAYADGELTDDSRIRVDAALACDPNVQRRLAVFTATGKNLANLFDAPMQEPVPARLIHAITSSTDGAGASNLTRSSEANVVRFPSRRRPPFIGTPARAMAASLTVLLAAASAFWLLKPPSNDAQSTFGLATSGSAEKIAGDALASVLETVPSARTAERKIASEIATIRPTFSFATSASGYCRQYDIFRDKLDGLTGVACRQPTGAWRIEIHWPSGAHLSSSDAVLPAGREDREPIESVVDGLISGDVLGPDDEVRVMSNGWRRAKP
jgi:hypothetical protein